MVRLSSRKAAGSHKGVSLGSVLPLEFWRDDVAKASRGVWFPGRISV